MTTNPTSTSNRRLLLLGVLTVLLACALGALAMFGFSLADRHGAQPAPAAVVLTAPVVTQPAVALTPPPPDVVTAIALVPAPAGQCISGVAYVTYDAADGVGVNVCATPGAQVHVTLNTAQGAHWTNVSSSDPAVASVSGVYVDSQGRTHFTVTVHENGHVQIGVGSSSGLGWQLVLGSDA